MRSKPLLISSSGDVTLFGAFYFQVLHASNFNGFALENFGRLDAISTSPSPIVAVSISWSNERFRSTRWRVSSAAIARPSIARSNAIRSGIARFRTYGIVHRYHGQSATRQGRCGRIIGRNGLRIGRWCGDHLFRGDALGDLFQHHSPARRAPGRRADQRCPVHWRHHGCGGSNWFRRSCFGGGWSRSVC